MAARRERLALVAIAALAGLLPAGASGSTGTPGAPPISIDLTSGWEASDGDPAGGVAGLSRLAWRAADPLRETAPSGAVRWYRVRLDLSRLQGEVLAFSVPGLRDVDETFFDGVKIGGQGSFPPRLDLAILIPRLYPIPSRLVESPGLHLVAIRVYHGRRAGTVFRVAPVVDRYVRLAGAMGRIDQAAVLFLGIAGTIAVVLFLFAFHARKAYEYPIFAALSLLLGFHVLTLHSGWGVWPFPRETPFRIFVVCSALLGVCYLEAVRGLLRAPRPRRYLLYEGWFVLLALAAVAARDGEALVVPLGLHTWIFLVALVDLTLPIGRALWAGSRRAPTLLLGHLAFLAGGVFLADLVPPFGPAFPGTFWGIGFLSAGYAALAMTFLWAMSDQLTHFRVAAMTDSLTRLWNRQALFDEIGERIDVRRRGASPPFGLVLVDLDHFKAWNDQKGHLAGDRLLVRVARALQAASRAGDLVARYGGDEFAVVLEDVDVLTAPAVVARFHEAIAAGLSGETGESRVSASIGVSVFDPSRHPVANALLQDADRALYQAKEAGRNRIVLFRLPPVGSGSRRRTESGRFLRRLKKPGGDSVKRD